MEMITVLEYLLHRERLKVLEVSSQEKKRLLGDNIEVFQYLKGAYRKHGKWGSDFLLKSVVLEHGVLLLN